MPLCLFELAGTFTCSSPCFFGILDIGAGVLVVVTTVFFLETLSHSFSNIGSGFLYTFTFSDPVFALPPLLSL